MGRACSSRPEEARGAQGGAQNPVWPLWSPCEGLKALPWLNFSLDLPTSWNIFWWELRGQNKGSLRDLTLPPQVPPEVDEEGFTVRPDVSHNNILSVTVSPWGGSGPGPCPV